MSLFESLRISGFDHLEFAVADLDRAADVWLRLGFEKAGTRSILERKLSSYLLVQNGLAIVLSQSTAPTDPVSVSVAAHGDGLFGIAFRCEDAVSTLELTVNRGAEVAESPKSYKKDLGEVTHASIRAFGDVRHTFVSRKGSLFGEGFDTPFKSHTKGYGLERLDHVTAAVEAGQLETCVQFYERVFGLTSSEIAALPDTRACATYSPDRAVQLLFHEPGAPESAAAEFIAVHHGPGVQHVAFETRSIISTLRSLRAEHVPLLTVPSAYYEELPARVPALTESVTELQELGILADQQGEGYLLHAFSQPVAGPFVYEILQREGNLGFGHANASALMEAWRKDRSRAGVLE